MAHDLETWIDGSASFVSARQHAWHRLGTVLPETFDAEQAMAHAKLGGWNVRKEALHTTVITADGVTTVDVPQRRATVRTNPVTGGIDVLGVVGAGYEIIQNEQHAELLNVLVDQAGAHFETAGSLDNGRQVFLTMKLPRDLLIGGRDRVDTYLVALNSHDGSSAFRLLITPVRVVCANTQAAAIGAAEASFSIWHKAGARASIAEARQALGMTWKYLDEFEAQAQAMIAQQMSDDQFAAIVERITPASGKGDRAQATASDRAAALVDLWRESPTSNDIRGTKWAAYQAVTEYYDHFAPVRDRTADANAVRARRAATSGQVNAAKLRAFDLIRSA